MKRAIILLGLVALAAGLWLEPGRVDISGDDIEPVRYERAERSLALPSSASGTWVTSTATTATGPVCITTPTAVTSAWTSTQLLTVLR